MGNAISMKHKSLVGIAVFAAMCPIVCSAVPERQGMQTLAKDSLKSDGKTLPDVEVSTSRLGRQVTSLSPLQSMSKREMEALGLWNLADAVKTFAGAFVKDYGGIGGMKTVSVRNLGAHHTAVGYDGITISNTEAGQVDIGALTTDNVEMLSLAYGAVPDIMASARHFASAGLLEIKTQKPDLLGAKRDEISLKMRTGSFGLLAPSLLWWHRIGQRTRFSVFGKYVRADGSYPFMLKNGDQTTKEKRYNSDVETMQGEMNLYHEFSDSSLLSVKLYAYSQRRGLPGSVILYNRDHKERMADENIFLQAVYKRHYGEKWEHRTRLKYTHSWSRYEDYNLKYQDGVDRQINRQNEYYLSSSLGYQPLECLRFALAEDAFVNTLENNIPTQPSPVRFTSLSSLSAFLKLPRFEAEGNIVCAFKHEHLDRGKGPKDCKQLSPTLSMSYRLLANTPLFLRLMVKRAYRMPSFNDLYYARVGSTDLQPERALLTDLGLTLCQRITRGLSLQVTVDGYLNRVKDKIVAFPTTYVWKMVNFGKVNIQGLDATMALDVSLSKSVRAQLTAAYTLQEALDKTDHERSTYNCQLPYTPRHSGNASLTVFTPWLNVGYAANFVSMRSSMGNDMREYQIPGYAEHNVTLSRKMSLRKSEIEASLTLNNIFDKSYEVIQFYPMEQRNFTFTLSWKW